MNARISLVILISFGTLTVTHADNCARACTREFDPVCARDPNTGRTRTYSNNCMMGYLNCKERTQNIFVFHGECSNDPVIRAGGAYGK